MEAILKFLSNPTVLIILGLVAIAILFLIFRTLLKFAIICVLLILLSVVGYHFYRAEGKFNERMRDSLLRSKGQIEQWVEKGKESLFQGKKFFDQKQDETKKSRNKKLEDV